MRTQAVTAGVISFIIFLSICIFGAEINTLISLAIAFIFSSIIMMVICPPSNITSEDADYVFGIYIGILILTVLVVTLCIFYEGMFKEGF